MAPALKSNNFDYFSNLPDSVFHQILALLDIKYLARIATLNSRCRTLCLSSPFLNIDLKEVTNEKKMQEFMSFLHRFICLRDGTIVHQFHLHSVHDVPNNDMVFHIGTWLMYSAKRCVERISLDCLKFERFSLPSCVLSCASLKSLKLSLDYGLLTLPKVDFVSLEELQLSSVSFPDNFLIGEWISRSCKKLKELDLKSFHGIEDLNISSTSLEKLFICNMKAANFDLSSIKVTAIRLWSLTINWYFMYEDNSLEIHAPNLRYFVWLGGIPKTYSLHGSFERLKVSHIILHYDSQLHDVQATFYKDLVFKHFPLVLSLQVSGHIIEMVSTLGLPLLNKLISLQTCFFDGKFPVPAFASFLKSTPHLKFLRICHWSLSRTRSLIGISSLAETSYDAKYWESQKLAFVGTLENVEIDIKGGKNETELIKYLAGNAVKLKKMTILYSSNHLSEAKIIGTKLSKFKIASSCAKMYMLPK